MAQLFLTQDEVIELTGKKHYSSQAFVLSTMGIEHKIRPDGKIIVLRNHVEKVFNGIPLPASIKETEPDWSSLTRI